MRWKCSQELHQTSVSSEKQVTVQFHFWALPGQKLDSRRVLGCRHFPAEGY